MNDQVLDETKVEEFVGYLKVGVAVLALVAVGAGAYFFYEHLQLQKSEKAFTALFEAEKMEESAAKEAEALKLEPTQAMLNWPADRKKEYEDRLLGVEKSFSGTSAAATALLRAARWRFVQGDFAQAALLYRDVISKVNGRGQSVFKAMAFEGLGVALESQKNFDEAENVYKDALALKDNPLKPLAYLGQARVLNSLGKKAEVKGLYEKLIKEFPNTPYERKARALMALEG